MPRLVKKYWFTLIVLFLLFGRVVSYAQDEFVDISKQIFQEQTGSSQPNLTQTVGGDKENDDGFFDALILTSIHHIRDLKSDETTGENQGAIHKTTNLIAGLYILPPASGVNYIADLQNNFFGLGGKTAYAQGTGFTGLQPILPIWKVFRNIVYALYAVIFVVIGFLIIFRMKISAQATISIQNALPKAVITLLLVTFSYAIAGLVIDLSYVVLFLALRTFEFTGALSSNITDNMQHAFLYGGTDASVADMFSGPIRIVIHTVAAGLGALIGAIVGSIVPFFGTIAGAIGGAIILELVFLIIILFLLIKLFFSLLKTYINILLSIIFAPVVIATGAMPIQAGGFGSWLKGLIANILVFPVVGIIIMVGRAIIEVNQNSGVIWKPPILFGSTNLLQSSGYVVDIIISLGLFLLLPSIPDVVRQAFGIKDSGIGALIGKTLKPITNLTEEGAWQGANYSAKWAGGNSTRVMGWVNKIPGVNMTDTGKIDTVAGIGKSVVQNLAYLRGKKLPP